MEAKYPCPICRKPTSWEGNPFRPFCSERCKLLDLGNWLDGRYGIPAEKESTEEDVEMISRSENDEDIS